VNDITGTGSSADGGDNNVGVEMIRSGDLLVKTTQTEMKIKFSKQKRNKNYNVKTYGCLAWNTMSNDFDSETDLFSCSIAADSASGIDDNTTKCPVLG
jgi:hypothetical protein